ncbi:MAG: 4Fe-4S dicluster domain-containing protein, partial [Promethearchaeota archaeon]
MNEKIMKKSQISELFNLLKEDNEIYAPAKKNNVLSFRKVSSTDEIILDFYNTRMPPKEVVFPRVE